MNITATQLAQLTAVEKATCRSIFLEEETQARGLELFYLWLPIPSGALKDHFREAVLVMYSRSIELDRLADATSA